MTSRIVHLGFGAFHRAHQAPLTQAAGGWEIEAVAMRDPSAAQLPETAYGLVVRHPDGPEVQRIDVVTAVHALPGRGDAVAARMADADTHVVGLTVTEKGYGLDRATGGLAADAPRVAADLASPRAPEGPTGLIVEACRLRRAAGLPGLTVMSCDNLPENGAMTRRAVLDHARLLEADLAGWIEASCAFPSSMVDRITPKADDATFAASEAALGRADPLATDTEPFLQWVIEDAFAGPRPAWEDAGAQIVADVAPYETMKLRMLNGAHSFIAYAGLHHGLTHVRDVMTSPLRAEAEALVRAAARTLDDALDTDGYAAALLTRFENPAIAHRCAQIAMDGSQKLPQRLLASAGETLAAGGDPVPFARAVAYWMAHIPTEALNDPLADELRAAMRAADPLPELGRLLGADALFAAPRWRAAVEGAFAEIGRR